MHDASPEPSKPPARPTSGAPETTPVPAASSCGVPGAATAAVLFLLAAAWLAASSTGLLAHPLRHALVWLALAGALVTGGAGPGLRVGRLLVLVIIGALAATLASSSHGAVCALAAAFTACALAALQPAATRGVFRAAAVSTLLFAVYRLLYLSAPAVWSAANGLGTALGDVGGVCARESPWVGATFAGVDVLLLAVAFHAAWIAYGPRPRLRRGLVAIGFVLAAQFVYLILVAQAAALHRALLDAAKAPEPGALADIASWLGPAVPWNMPALAGVLQLLVAGLALRWTRPGMAAPAPRRFGHGGTGLVRKLAPAAAAVSAILLALTTTLSTSSLGLEGKKLVIYEKLYGNFDRPRHGNYGRLSIGMYGMFEVFVNSLGGTLVRSKDLGDADLADADALIVIYPSRPWQPGQLERIERFVRKGGGLLVAGEHTTRITLEEALANRLIAEHLRDTGVDLGEDYGSELRIREAVKQACYALAASTESEIDLSGTAGKEFVPWRIRKTLTAAEVDAVRGTLDERASYVNQVLAPTAMTVRFDSATFTIGGWLHSYEALAHPTSIGIGDDRNQIGVVIGASVEARRPARPLLIGKWGWNDPGEESAGESMMGNDRYDAGEKLGDVVLAAEQRLGKGVVIAFGDTSGFTNGITMGAHDYTSRLFGYLANGAGGPGSAGREALGILLALVLAGSLLVVGPGWMAAVALLLGLAVSLSATVTYRSGEILPDGRRVPAGEPNNLAYIDTTHLERAVGESWRMEGLMGLRLNLMRSGLQVLDLPEFTARRLEMAGLLISVGPSRTFTSEERDMVHTFVENGGVFILTAGYPDAAASRELLARFGFEIGLTDLVDRREPLPMGLFKSRYLDTGEYATFVRFHSVWPVGCTEPDTPPAGWRARERLDPPTFRRTGYWYAEKALAAVVPWLQPTPPARVVAYGTGNYPVILWRHVGRGKVVVVGDTAFAMNKNLEVEGGQPFEGMRENPHFWRWFLTVLRDQEEWTPPKPVPESDEGGN